MPPKPKPPTATPTPPAAARAAEQRDPVDRVYGLAAVLAVLHVRPEQVINIAHTAALRRELGPVLREAARRRIAYREVSEEELAKMADSQHHEGVCVLVRRKVAPSLDELAHRTVPTGLIVALDQVGNPHNAGAILRTAAFFGARGLLLASNARETLTPAALRVAEGGAEHVPVAHSADLSAALTALRAHGLGIVGADSKARMPLAALKWPKRCVLVLGHEREGLSPEARKCCDVGIHIAGSGALDSLNVSVAAGVLIASYAVAHGTS